MVADSTRKRIEAGEARRLQSEKQKHGFEPGVRFDTTVQPIQQYLIEVAWYPKTKWTAKPCRHDGRRWHYGKSFVLTEQFWAKLTPLRLS